MQTPPLTISKFIRDGDSVYSCFYDVASAFDTVEYRSSQSVKTLWHIRKNLVPHQRLVLRCALIHDMYAWVRQPPPPLLSAGVFSRAQYYPLFSSCSLLILYSSSSEKHHVTLVSVVST